MEVMVLKGCNLNSITEKQWNTFCEYLGPFLEAYAKVPAVNATVEVSKDGESAMIIFYLKVYESSQTVIAKFDKYICKEWIYHNCDKKIKNIPPYNVILSWQVFLTKVFGEMYEVELDNYYKKKKVNNGLIKTIIQNSQNEFKF